MKRALLLSGGMDSISLAWWMRPEIAFTINYGQLAQKAELHASSVICNHLGISHEIIEVDCRGFGSGDMAGKSASRIAPQTDWWPYRNQLLISVAAAKAIELDVSTIWLGTVKSDSAHQDGTPKFIELINKLMVYQEGGIAIEAPAIKLSTIELVQKSGIPIEMLSWAHSCHTSDVTCGNCRGCNKYFEVFNGLDHDLA